MTTPVAPAYNQFQSTVRSGLTYTHTFGFLPPHGRTLTAGQELSFSGDLTTYFSDHKNRRKSAAFQAAILSGALIYKYGAVAPETALCHVLNTTVIAAGDLVFLDNGGDVKSASVYTWTSNLATTQANFKKQFLGVALAAHANGGGATNTFPVDVSPAAVYAFPCTSATYEIADSLGLAKAAGNALLPQKLEAAVFASAIARVAQKVVSAGTTVSVRFEAVLRGADGGAGGSQDDQGFA